MLLITESHRYAQCELMSVHYKHPLLLIEFEEQKSFSLEVSGVFLRHEHPKNDLLRSMPPEQDLSRRGKESSRPMFRPISQNTYLLFRRKS